MHISTTSAILPINPTDRHPADTHALDRATTAAANQAVTEPKPFAPAPPLRPNVQDYVDIDRTLIALRKL